MGEPTFGNLLARVFLLFFVAGMAWLGWTYLEIGTTFFGWLPPLWLNITFLHFLGLVIMVQTVKWFLSGLRTAIIGR